MRLPWGVTVPAENVTVGVGTIKGPGSMTISGTFNWEGGWLTGAGTLTIAPNAVMNINREVPHWLNNRRIDNSGTILWTAGQVNFENGAVLNNQGAFEARPSPNDFYHQLNNASGGGTFNNTGTFRKVGTAITTIFVRFDNRGTVDTQSGRLLISGDGASYRDWMIAAGASVEFRTFGYTLSTGTNISGAGRVEVYPGTVTISGTVQVQTLYLEAGQSRGTLVTAGSATLQGTLVNNGGEVNPGGNGIGVLTITGNYTQGAGGMLSVDVSGVPNDQLSVNGSVTLSGTLNVIRPSGFIPPLGNSFSILSFGSRNGDFATKLGLDIGGSPPRRFDPQYSPNALALVVVQTGSGPGGGGERPSITPSADTWSAHTPQAIGATSGDPSAALASIAAEWPDTNVLDEELDGRSSSSHTLGCGTDVDLFFARRAQDTLDWNRRGELRV